MWRLLVAVLRLPVSLLGLSLWTILGVPYCLLGAACCVVRNVVAVPFWSLYALFANRPQDLPHIDGILDESRRWTREIPDVYASLRRWASGK